METLVRAAAGAHDQAGFARLVNEHIEWMRALYREDDRLIVAVLDQQTFTEELANLATIYGPPNGRTFLAVAGEAFLGCGAYRRLDATTCEMKRVFVAQRFRGARLGRRLCEALLDAARRAGYARIKLDTLDRMEEAARLYRSLGFRECAPYNAYPAPLMPRVIFMELAL